MSETLVAKSSLQQQPPTPPVQNEQPLVGVAMPYIEYESKMASKKRPFLVQCDCRGLFETVSAHRHLRTTTGMFVRKNRRTFAKEMLVLF